MIIKSKQKIITLVAGGTGGHIYPALAILYEIKKINFYSYLSHQSYQLIRCYYCNLT